MAKPAKLSIPDEGAFLKLFDEHYRPLFRFAYRLTCSSTEAEDIVQECFLALLRQTSNYDPSRSSLRVYLFGAVRNQALKRFRKREPGIPGEAADARTPEVSAIEDEISRAVSDAIAALPDTQREILILAHYEQVSLSEIAEITELEVT